MKKGRFIILIMSVVFLVCSVVPSYAEQKSGWYSSEITLPRYLTTGQSYWLTKKRKATVVNTGTGVHYPKYIVYYRIYTGSGTKYLSSELMHDTNTSEPRWHYTDVKGTYIKAGFRNAMTTVHTNKVELRWKP